MPPPLQLRKEIQRLPDAVCDLPSEQEVRDIVEKLNQRIMDWLRSGSGPQVQVGPVDVESVVEQWRANQSAATQGAAAATCADKATMEEAPAVRTRWWRRIARRRGESS